MNPAATPGTNDHEVILDSINEGVFTVDLDWRITSFNRAAERITGIDRQEAIGRHCWDVFHPDICEHACPLRQALSTGRPLLHSAGHIINHRGQQVPIRISAALLKDNEGRVTGGVETFQDLSQVEELRKEIEKSYSFEDIVGRSPAMRRLFDILPQVAASSTTVLLEGASGTGKELFARAIHHLSPRRNGPFVAVNCAALPESLLESELFGHRAGAFTDAKRGKPGRFTLANGGTIFLDELSDISPALQVKLLRVLQEREVEPLGALKPVKVDVRVIAATNKDLADLVRTGIFRDDLYYRIRVVHLKLPPLRQRREDIPLLIDHLIAKFNRIQGRDIAGISRQALARLLEYDFPGNVRELENIIEHAFVLCRGGIIELHHLPPELRPPDATSAEVAQGLNLRQMEKHLITEALWRHHGSRRQAARELGIDTSTLYRKIKSLGINPPETDGRGRKRHY